MIVLSIIVSIASAGIVLVSMLLLNKQEKVIIAEAGDTGAIVNRKKSKNIIHMRPITLKDDNGNPIDKTNLIRVLVDGKCMERKGIKDGTQLYAKAINHSIKLSKQISQGDVLLIYLTDKNIYKLRVFDKIGGGTLATYRYDINTGERKNSSKPHRPESVIGVVQYLL